MTTQRILNLRARWRSHVLALGGFDAAAATKAFEGLCASYSETQRHYHTLDHLTALFDTLEHYADEIGDPTRVAFAAWYHDAVYDPEAKDNEEQSAERAVKELKALGAQKIVGERVAQLILATKQHMQGGSDYDDDVFLDADFAILGAPAEKYREYTEQIREEYGHLSDEEWKEGRLTFLERIATAPRIFRTGVFEGDLAAQARTNIGWEIKQLESAHV